MTAAIFCPECGNRFKLGAHPQIGQRKVCPSCGMRLEIAHLSPLVLDVYDLNRTSPRTASQKKAEAEAICPQCDHSLKLGTHPHQGQQVRCLECMTPLEVVSLNPLELDIPMAVWKKGLK